MVSGVEGIDGTKLGKAMNFPFEEWHKGFEVEMPDWNKIFSKPDWGNLSYYHEIHTTSVERELFSNAIRRFREEQKDLFVKFPDPLFKFLARFGPKGFFLDFKLKEVRESPVKLLGWSPHTDSLCGVYWPPNETCALQDPNSGAPIEMLFLFPPTITDFTIGVDPYSGTPVLLKFPKYDGRHAIVPLSHPSSGAPLTV